MYIIGFETTQAVPYAVKVGVALQLTNILRDVGEELRHGRFYLPHDELARYGIRESNIAAGRVTDAWRLFMRLQIERICQLYREAWPGMPCSRDGQWAVGAAVTFYRGILEAIEANDYDVFTKRVSLSAWQKLRRLPALWWQLRAS